MAKKKKVKRRGHTLTLVPHIKKAMSEGHSKEDIHKKLENKKWPKKHIKKAFNHIEKENKKPKKINKIVKTNSQTGYITSIDRFYAYIQKHEEVPLSKAAKHVEINKKLAESWAKILSEHHLIELNYPVFGEPILKCKL